MIPEIGSFAVILALCFAILQSVLPLITKYRFSSMIVINPVLSQLAIGQFVFLSLAMLCLIISFINNDMSVLFVRLHSHELLPLVYRIGAAWGGHEGSLLLWCLILGLWSAAFALFRSHKLSDISFSNIMMTLGWISAGFIIFLLATSNPFLREFPGDFIAGNDLIPLLQDPGLIFHPPILYLGYVGFVVGFAFAVSALLEKKIDSHWVSTCRPWIIIPWFFLGCGIILGSAWAYRELGWGGWWFWDPVENASLLPWLTATALIHSLIVTEKRQVFQGWTLLLAIVTFALSLLGTFLVRSGVLVSVHAFASDPTRGLFLLCYLAGIIGMALFLYATQIHRFYQTPRFSLFSRETFLLISSIVLLSLTTAIIIGTLYPILLEILNGEKISVGEPYFNSVFVPVILPLLILMGFAPHIHWGQQSLKLAIKKLHLNIIISLILSTIGMKLLGYELHVLTAIGVFIACWIVLSTLQYSYQKYKYQHTLTDKNLSMIVAHVGIAILVLGVTINKSYSVERQVKMLVGETATLNHYQFTFDNIEDIDNLQYKGIIANFTVQHHHSSPIHLAAEMRTYRSHEQFLNKPAINISLLHDLYLSLGTPFSDGSWSVRLYYKPCIRWIWAGGFLILLGGMIALIPTTRGQRK